MQNSLVSPKDTDKTGGSSLLSRTSKLLFVLIVFFSATQLGYHFWPLSALVYGIRIDYLSPVIYFLDILIVLYLGLATLIPGSDPLRKSWPAAKMFSRATTNSETGSDPQSVLLPLLLTNLLYSQNPLATLNWSLHFLLYFIFIATSFPEFRSLRDSRRVIGTFATYKTLLVGALIVALTFQLTLAITQVYLGHSAGGFMYYLGERMVGVGSPGIATASYLGQVVLRAYGTFGHPNVLAGWAVVSFLILIQIGQTAIPKVSKQRAVRRSVLLRKSWLSAKMSSRLQNTIRRPGQILWVLLILVTLLVFLTASRSATLSLFGFIIPLYFLKNFKTRSIYWLVILLVCWFVNLSFLSPLRSDLSLSERVDLQKVSIKTISQFPLFGTGAQSSISTYPQVSHSSRLLQPDHNSFTLIFSWFGLFGVLALFSASPGSDLLRKSWPTAKMFSRTSKTSSETRSDPQGIIVSFLPLLPLLLLDHYLLTSPQGLFIFLLYLRLVGLQRPRT